MDRRRGTGERGARNAGAVCAPTPEVGRAEAARGQDGKAGEGSALGGEMVRRKGRRTFQTRLLDEAVG